MFGTLESKDPDTFEFYIETHFAEPVLLSDLPTIHELIASLVKRTNKAESLLIGILSLHLDVNGIEITLLFSTDTKHLEHRRADDIDFESKIAPSYIFYFFALIDQRFRLEDRPFPPEFRDILQYGQRFMT